MPKDILQVGPLQWGWIRTRAETYRNQAISYLKLAGMTVDLDVQNRFIKIAQHCRMLADAEERDAESRGIGRRSGNSHKSG